MTRPGTDYSTTTRFHVYTTQGTMQQVSQHAAAYTTSLTEKYTNTGNDGAITGTPSISPGFVHSFHSNVIHTQNTTYWGGVGNLDCETNTAGSQASLDCLSKGDKIFLLNLGDRDGTKCESASSTANIAGVQIADSFPAHGGMASGNGDSCFFKADATSFNSNPLYPNMYTVKKIGKIAKGQAAAERINSHIDETPTES